MATADKTDIEYMEQSFKKQGLSFNEEIFKYTFWKGPNIKDEHMDDILSAVHYNHNRWGRATSKECIADIDKRINKEIEAVCCNLVNKGYYDFMMGVVKIPLLFEYLIHILNDDDVDMGQMFMSRVKEEAEEIGKKCQELMFKIMS